MSPNPADPCPPSSPPAHVLVVGLGMAGARCAAELRTSGTAKVTVLGAEPHAAYNRILLSSLLAGKATEDSIALPESGFDALRDTTVTSIDREARTVTTSTGEVFEYDHLVLATGSAAWVPPLPGLDPADLPERVAVFRTLDDCRRILSLVGAEGGGRRRAIVLGGGLLGLEAARGLAMRGLHVDVVHPMGFLMERQLDAGASEVLVGTLARHGVNVHLECSGTGLRVGADGVELTISDGRTLEADLLVIACGVRSETSLAAAAGLTVQRGIVVDDRLRTSDPNISAIGDCAQHGDSVGGLVAPAWAQASIVARLLTGTDPEARYQPAPLITRLKATGIDLAAMGELAGDGAEDLRFTDPSRGTYARLRIRDGRVAGAVLLGDNPSVGQVIQLFDRGAPVPADRRSLLLGRALGGGDAVPAVTPALMPDAVTVCQCNNVSKGAIIRACQEGAHDLGAVAARTRATTGCGSCSDAVSGILGWLATQGVAA